MSRPQAFTHTRTHTRTHIPRLFFPPRSFSPHYKIKRFDHFDWPPVTHEKTHCSFPRTSLLLPHSHVHRFILHLHHMCLISTSPELPLTEPPILIWLHLCPRLTPVILFTHTPKHTRRLPCHPVTACRPAPTPLLHDLTTNKRHLSTPRTCLCNTIVTVVNCFVELKYISYWG